MSRCGLGVEVAYSERSHVSWDRRNAQEVLDSYEGTMRNNHGLGEEKVLTELSEIGRIEGSMTELGRIGRIKALLQSLSGSVVLCSYDRSQGNWFEDAVMGLSAQVA